MSVAETDDLVVVELAAGGDDPSTGPGRSLPELVDALGTPSRRLSGQIELATTLEDLRTDGIVRLRDDGGEARYALTERGAERARAVRDRLADLPIDVVDGDDERTLELSAAAAEFDRSLVEIVADCTGDGTYYRQDDAGVDRVVGRDAERDRCDAVLEAVRDDGRGRALFLSGPGGVGKTTLASAVLEGAHGTFDVVRASCRSADEPFQPLRECLSQLDVERPPFDDARPDADDPESFRTRQAGLFYDVTDLLAPAADEGPRIVFLDDLHLADPATMAYLEYLLERLADHPLVVLGCYRDADLSDDAPAAAIDADDESVTRVRLGPLDREGTRGVIERVLERRGVPDAFVDAVHECTGGTPLFVEETVSRLLETNQLDPGFEWYPEDADAVDVPDAVRETIERRVDALDPAARELLRWAAVIGDRVPLAVLERVCDVTEIRFRTLIDALVEADVFERTGDGEAVTFRTDVVREALAEDVDADVRRDRHAAVAAALEDVLEDGDAPDGEGAGESDGAPGEGDAAAAVGDRPATIATHHERAGNREAAVEWYWRAGERATDVYAHDAAVDHYHSALALAREGDDEETVLSGAERLADTYLTIGAFDEAERYVAFARERADDVDRRQRLAVLATRIANERGEYEAAVRHATDALELDETPSETRCELLNQRARAERERSEFDRAGETARRQLEEARAVDAPALEARAAQQLGAIEQAQGKYEPAREHLEDALETFERLEYLKSVAQIRTILGMSARGRGDLETAREYLEDALEGYRTVGDRSSTATVRVNLGIVALDRSEYETAREYFEDALAEFRAVGDQHRAAVCRHNLGETAIGRGEYETAVDHLERSRSEAAEIGDRRLVARSGAYAGEAALAQGRYDEAADALERALAEAEEVGDRRGAATARMFRGALAIERGAYEDAEEHLEDALETLEAIGNRRLAARTHTFLGALALQREARETAEDHLAAALETLEAIGARRFEARARTLYGVLAVDRGAYEVAEERLTAALETAEAVEARHDVARATAGLGRLALARGDEAAAAERFADALEGFDAVGAAADALETLEDLVVLDEARGDDVRVRDRLERARDLVASVDDPAGRWVSDRRVATESTGDDADGA